MGVDVLRSSDDGVGAAENHIVSARAVLFAEGAHGVLSEVCGLVNHQW